MWQPACLACLLLCKQQGRLIMPLRFPALACRACSPFHVTMDLHGMDVPGACEFLTRQLDALTLVARGHPGGGRLAIITGKGLHSRDGVPRIKNAVLKHLGERRRNPNMRLLCEFAERKGNEGVLDVLLPEDV